MFCKECGAEINNKAVVCVKCGCAVSQTEDIYNKNNGALDLNFAGLSPYYQEEFKKIYESNETYKGKWNWCAFLCGGIWALTKGVWASVVVTVIASIFTVGVYAIVFWFICGIRGNYMYYNAYVKRKQLFI